MQFPSRRYTKAFERCLLVCLLSFSSFAASKVTELKPETIAAWDDYLAGVQKEQAKRLSGARSFLAASDNKDAISQIKAGRVLVLPAEDNASARIPFGLVNHWTGVILIRNVKLSDVTAVTRSYERYPELYKPTVIGARTESKGRDDDRFSMRLLNKALFAEMSLDIKYSCHFQNPDDQHLVAISRSTEIRQIDHFGKENQRMLPPDEGRGYIWRIVNFARMQQTKEGVILEFETVVLSRDVPSGLRWMVDPVIRRVAQSALSKTLAQTRDAILAGEDNAKPQGTLSLR